MTTLILAPLKGYTDRTFRNIYARYFNGFDGAIAPFIPTVQGRRVKQTLVDGLRPEKNRRLAVIPQILGKAPDDFILLARVLSDLGHDEINWNLGCPSPMVVKKGRGSGLLSYPERIDAFLERVIPAVPARISIKLRLGRKEPEEIFQVLPVLNRFPLSELIIHPRTGAQMYSGRPNLDVFNECAQMSAFPVTYNGDINCLDDFQRLSRRFPDQRKWMIGRGALVNPFLPAIIKTGTDTISGKTEQFKRFHDALFEGYQERLSGPAHLLARMKGFWKYFALGFPDGAKRVKKIHRSQKIEIFTACVERFFSDNTKWVGIDNRSSIDERLPQ